MTSITSATAGCGGDDFSPDSNQRTGLCIASYMDGEAWCVLAAGRSELSNPEGHEMRMKRPRGYKHIRCPHCGEKIRLQFRTMHRMKIEVEG